MRAVVLNPYVVRFTVYAAVLPLLHKIIKRAYASMNRKAPKLVFNPAPLGNAEVSFEIRDHQERKFLSKHILEDMPYAENWFNKHVPDNNDFLFLSREYYRAINAIQDARLDKPIDLPDGEVDYLEGTNPPRRKARNFDVYSITDGADFKRDRNRVLLAYVMAGDEKRFAWLLGRFAEFRQRHHRGQNEFDSWVMTGAVDPTPNGIVMSRRLAREFVAWFLSFGFTLIGIQKQQKHYWTYFSRLWSII